MNLPGLFKNNYNLIISCGIEELEDCSKMVANTLFLQDEQEVRDNLLYGIEVPKLYRDIALSKRSKLLKRADEMNLVSINVEVQDRHTEDMA